MKSKILMSSLGAAALLAAGVALAAGTEAVTRSVEVAQSDLMGTYSRASGQPADQINWGENKGQVVGVGSSKPIVGVSSSGPQKAGRQ